MRLPVVRGMSRKTPTDVSRLIAKSPTPSVNAGKRKHSLVGWQ